MDNLVSVVIPTYKRYGEILENAIKSVLEQSYNLIEIIVVDDNIDYSYTKSIKEMLKKYPSIKYISYEGNKGACFARNEGIIHSNGKFCAFLDDDDEWYTEKITKQMEKFVNDSIALVYCGINYYYQKDDLNKEIYAEKKINPVKELLHKNYIGSTSCGIVRKSSALKVGLFDVNLKSGQDLDFWIRLALEYEIECVKECLIKYTLYENDSITSNVKNRLESNIYLYKKYRKIIEKDSILSSTFILKIFKSYWINNKKTKAFVFFAKSYLNKEITVVSSVKIIKRIKTNKRRTINYAN
ncbi:hypothetical protein AYO36_00865 [Exiguobacterium sp. KKBO11]|uniref:glycosyltransferase family 2 protein n=1 Tax=Exiguobacterium sp. KKBO11 TaxID=1805000 RepID=UPI0007D871DA|nr:glycosyltransferase family A protein [Exiguobacterium sp. KKBO11]OAI88721.1 hypothetical protein AYO36_00865 [Exiguobacterium sp. KKBO11]